MKKLLMALLIALAPKTVFALDRAKTVQELMDKTSVAGKFTAAMFALVSRPDWAKYKSMIRQFKNKDSGASSVLVDVESPEMNPIAVKVDITKVPTTLVMKDGKNLVGIVGLPKDLKEVQSTFEAPKKAADKI